MAGWFGIAEIAGELFSKITGLIGKAITDKDKANELTVEIKNVLSEFMGKYYEFVIAMEGEFKDLVALGVVGKVLAVGRAGWRIVLQWTLTLDIAQKFFIAHQSWQDLQAEILFTLGLAGLRTMEKKLPYPKRKKNNNM